MALTIDRNGSWRWMVAALLSAALSLAVLMAARSGEELALDLPAADPAATTSGHGASSPLADIAAEHPGRTIEVIVQLRRGAGPAAARELIAGAGGTTIAELPLIEGLAARMSAAAAHELSLSSSGIEAVSLNAAVEQEAIDPTQLATAYNQSIRAEKSWAAGYTGKGVGVAVIDTGIAGDLPDFRVSETDATSRVVASAVINPAATRAGDSFGHGTHVAGLIAGNGTNRPAGDPLDNRYVGVAPDANLIDVKVADENGDASVLDVIEGLQFVVDHRQALNIRVANLSLRSTVAESYKTDPLDAAVEAAWNSGIVVVVAAGNQGTNADAVSYAPANDPYVITVGGVDDMGTKGIEDDKLAPWSSRGTTQDGFAKPDLVAPGARLVSTIPLGSAYTQLCPGCVTDGAYFRVGGTSMAAALVSGEVANLLQAYPAMTPNDVKAQLIKRTRAVDESTSSSGELVDGSGEPVPSTVTTTTTITGAEAAVDKALNNPVTSTANGGLTPNSFLDPATGLIDYSRASWSRASWSDAIDPLRASWSRASWSRASWSRASWSATPETCADLERASWSRASWSRASWSRASWSGEPLTDEQIATIDAEIAAAQQECSALLASIDPSRASWSRASWSRASWSTSFTK